MKIITQEIPLIPIAHSKRYQARNENVTGDILAAFGGINFYSSSKTIPLKKLKKIMKTENKVDLPQIGEN